MKLFLHLINIIYNAVYEISVYLRKLNPDHPVMTWIIVILSLSISRIILPFQASDWDSFSSWTHLFHYFLFLASDFISFVSFSNNVYWYSHSISLNDHQVKYLICFNCSTIQYWNYFFKYFIFELGVI